MTVWVLAALLLIGPTTAPTGLKPFVRGTWQQLRQTHVARPTIVHLWGLSCAPCRAELPEWGRLMRDRRDADLIFVAADPEPEDPNRVSSVLAEAGLGGADNWMFGDSFVERLRFEIDPDWQGELPYTLLVGRDGSVKAMAGTVEFQQIRRWIDSQQKATASQGR